MTVTSARFPKGALVTLGVLILITLLMSLLPDRVPPPPLLPDASPPQSLDAIAPATSNPENIPAAPPDASVVPAGAPVLHGLVTDLGDRPLSGVRVGWNEDQVEGGTPETVLTGNDGRFRIADSGVKYVRLFAAAPGFAWAHSGCFDREREPARTKEEIRIRMSPGGSFSAYLVGPSGEPVPNAKLVAHVFAEHGGHIRVPPTGAGPGGLISLAHLPAGDLQLYVKAPGYAPAIFTGDDCGIRDGEATMPGRLELRAGHAAEGTVVDSKGMPVEGVRIQSGFFFDDVFQFTGSARLATDDRNCDFYEPWTTSDADGRFRLADLPFPEWRVQISKDGYVGQRHTQEPNGEPLSIVLITSGTIDIRIVRPGNEAATKFSVWTLPDGWRRGHVQELADPEGAITFTGARPGTRTFQAWTEDGLISDRLAVTIEEGEAAGPFTLQLALGGYFTGRVLDPEGRPVSAAKVRAREVEATGGPRPVFEATSGPDGTYRVGPVPPGLYRLEFTCVRLAGGLFNSVPVAAGQEVDSELHLADGGRLELAVTAREGAESRAVIHIRHDGGIPLWRRWPKAARGDGTLAVDHLPTGWVEVEAKLSNGRRRSERVEIVAGETRTLTIEF